jgi:hypothetical protein
MLTAFDGLLADRLDHLGCSESGGFENCRYDINHVVELGSNAARVFDVARAMT